MEIISDELCDVENPDDILCNIARAERVRVSKESNSEQSHYEDAEPNAVSGSEGQESIRHFADMDTYPRKKSRPHQRHRLRLHQRPRPRVHQRPRPRNGPQPPKLPSKHHPQQYSRHSSESDREDDDSKTYEDNDYDVNSFDDSNEDRSNEDSKLNEDSTSSDTLHQLPYAMTGFRPKSRSRNKEIKHHSVKGNKFKGLGKYFVYVNCNSCKVLSRLIVGGKAENKTNNDNETLLRRSLDNNHDGDDYSYLGDYDKRIEKHLDYSDLNLPIVKNIFVLDIVKTLNVTVEVNDDVTDFSSRSRLANVDENDFFKSIPIS